jgi:DNA-binding protein H-NS
MADYDHAASSLTAQRQLRKDIAKAISTCEDGQKTEVRAEVEAVAKELGYSLAERFGSDGEPKRVLTAPKYTHNESPVIT